MANICGVGFYLNFRTIKAKKRFVKDFTLKIAKADLMKEGIEIANDSKWLFDPMLFYQENDNSVTLVGWVKWSIEHEDIRAFSRDYLEKFSIHSFECYYEETGNMLYGKYYYEQGELIDYFVSESHPVWTNSNCENDNYFDLLDTALNNDGVMKIVA